MSEWRTFYSNYDDGTMFISRSPDPDDLLVDGLPGEIATAIVDAHNAALAVSAEPTGGTTTNDLLTNANLVGRLRVAIHHSGMVLVDQVSGRPVDEAEETLVRYLARPPVAGPDAGERLLEVALTVRRMVEDGHPDDPDWFRIITERLHTVDDLTDAALSDPESGPDAGEGE
jgi:hypothetical protein